MNPGLRILVVEDDAGFCALLEEQILGPLLRAAPASVLTIVASLEALQEALRDIHRPDITILDLTLPPHDMHATLAQLDAVEDATPVVILTGTNEERVRAVIGGRFTPVLEKDRVRRHPGMLERAIVFAIEKWHNHRWARIQECVAEIRRLAEAVPLSTPAPDLQALPANLPTQASPVSAPTTLSPDSDALPRDVERG